VRSPDRTRAAADSGLCTRHAATEGGSSSVARRTRSKAKPRAANPNVLTNRSVIVSVLVVVIRLGPNESDEPYNCDYSCNCSKDRPTYHHNTMRKGCCDEHSDTSYDSNPQ